MLIPRFWSRAESQAVTPDGRPVRFHVWRGSRTSPAEAQVEAQAAVGRIADRIRRGEGFPERYSYGERSLREEVLREIAAPGAADVPDAAITRNSYGALVLNAARAFFIDVDITHGEPREPPRQSTPAAEPAQSLWGIVDSLPLPGGLRSIFDQFRPTQQHQPGAPPPPRTPDDPTAPARDQLRQFVAGRPGWRVRVYRTYAGLRYLVTHAPFSPTGGETQAILTALGADVQYIRLCQIQKSFRARLTPKPWRIGMENPPSRFPFESPAHEQAMRAWEARYAQASQGRATCQFLEEIGDGAEHPDIAPLRALHDEQTRATSGLPLA
ncbi:MAG TPA: hypothetical protein VFS20_26605 [Longimicrobium sp.]|nr:hypothetical protein [Longimicrobium sp.]